MKKVIFFISLFYIFMTLISCQYINDIQNQSHNDNMQTENQETIGLLDKYHNVFYGTIGNKYVCMDIFKNGSEITIDYIEKNSENEHIFTGAIDAYKMIAKSNMTKEIITADLKDLYTKNIVKGDIALISGETTPVNLQMYHASGGPTINERYGYGDWAFNTKEVETFVSGLKKAFITHDKQKVSQMIKYPINIYSNGNKTTINDEQEFIKNYDNIVNSGFLNVISDAYTKFMFSNYQGIMFGEDAYNCWINKNDNEGLKVWTINN